MDVRMLYNQLQEEIGVDSAAIEVLQAGLEEKRELSRLLKKRIDAMPARRPTQLPDNLFAPTLASVVEEAIPALAGREFVVGDVADLVRGKIELGERGNARITTVLSRLEERGTITRTFTGGGNVPNRYVVAGSVAAPASAPEDDDPL